MNAADQRHLTPWLLGVSVILGALCVALAAGLGRGVQWKPPRASHPLPAAHHTATVQAAPLSDYAQIWQRPLFTVTRQPAPEAASDGQSVSLGSLELTGVILAPGLHMALLRDRSDGHGVRVREGAHLADGNWVLETLKPRSAVFVDHGRRTRLTLNAAAHGASAPAKVAADTPRTSRANVASPSPAHRPTAQQHTRIQTLKKRIEQRRRKHTAHAGDH